MSVSGRMARNTVTKWMAGVVVAATAFFLVKFQLEYFGKSGYGTVELLNTIVYLSILSELGLRTALGRHLAEHISLANPRRVNELFNSALVFYLGLALALALICGAGAPWIATAIKIPAESRDTVIVLIRVYVTLTALISFVTPSYAAVLEANHRFDLVDIIYMGEVLLRAVGLIVLLGVFDGGLYGWAVAMLGSKVVGLVVYAYYGHRACPRLRISPRYLSRSAYRDLFAVSVLVFLFQTVLQLNTLTDPFVLAHYLTPDAVALYKPALLVVISAYPFVSILSRQMRPLITAYHATGQTAFVNEAVVRGTRVTILMAIPFCVIFGCFARGIVEIWLADELGPDVAATALALLFLSLLDLSTHIRETQGAIMLGLNRLRYVTVVQVLGGILTLLGSFTLVGALHQRGWGNYSIIGVVIPALVIGWVQLVLITIYVGRQTELGTWAYIRDAFARPAGALAITLSVAICLDVAVHPDTLLTLIPCVTLTGCTWLAASWFIGCDAQDQSRIRNLLIGAFRRFRVSPPSG